MKAIFEIENKSEKQVFSDLEEISKKHKTSVKKEDTGKGYFILTNSKLQIVESVKGNQIIIQVWGASNEDIQELTNYWGQPKKLINEKPSPNDLAEEISRIPNITKMNKSDLLELLEISEKDFVRYKRLIDRLAQRKNASEELKKANEILKKF
ncbi:MAG: hypothetical protein K9W46_06365 [Candidatus Heimdallarchaeum endolithica]|uniref:Uncharacterized protein n=1 Tax=Candidatus Heimdallarchaeum endolithica TaxID=2876572 RepID=A0A9Y1FRB0_9ARCH|nr:MAG: hypothetical protein K9W46_06365 [Candidatus Heimdallarchaeum endolithica]